MGCTSSAPNMTNSSTAEKSIQLEDVSSDDNSKYVEEIIYRAANETNVLPSCDTIPEPIHLVRNKSTPSVMNYEKEKPEEHIRESIIKIESNASIHREEKMPRLEALVDKVFGLHTEHIDETALMNKVEEPLKVEETTQKLSIKEDNAEDSNKDSTEAQVLEKDADLEEALSPSQSESSRATRWEALADIAAELPPSLTVDPITGQIYSVAK